MKLKLVFLLILTLLFFVAAPFVIRAQKNGLIGYKHKGVTYGSTLPNGAKDLGGGLLADENYGVTRFSKNGKFMLWLERISARDKQGVPSWIVKDVLTFEKLKTNHEFLLSYSSGCQQNGKENLDLIVQAQFLPKTKTYKVINAWLANTKKERFEKISTKKITCQYNAP